ncbi:MAG: TIGR03905 family TSCPD domain-containing protein [Clostridia bacterium]|nr:TIGR03905 family TSCPD domain-containing protein [Clostridia bacterium]
MDYSYKTQGTCSREIYFSIEDGKVKNVRFMGGCDGNLKAISKLCEGMEATKVAELLRGNTCGFKPTSCGDQLARAIDKAIERND